MDDQLVVYENARAVCNKPLPPLDPLKSGHGTILLFYQYIEPLWTKAEHKQALKKVIEIGNSFSITGRGRVAPEGLNCTLTGRPQDIRSFCYALREWQDIFNETDFKLTDGVEKSKLFKSLSIRKANELVAYGLAGEKAPSLKKFGGTHLEADEYHEAMHDPDTVIVDVRNAYESAIGSFQPPKGGAKLIDPKMRNSIEFPKWLANKETQEQLNGKKVLMYCTGGIRCERATALLNQMSTVCDEIKPKGVYHCRGGIERYVKTFPTGGFWRGKNYLFDRRMEQAPSIKSAGDVENDVNAKCCVCRKKWTVYRGQYKCNRSLCRVPVIVCDSCTYTANEYPENLVCELCREGHRAPSELPDLISMKRDADELNHENPKVVTTPQKKPKIFYKDRLFVRRLPLTVTAMMVKNELGTDNVKFIHWLQDRRSAGFYGSCVLLMSDEVSTNEVLERSSRNGGIKIEKKRVKVEQVFVRDDKDLFTEFVQKEWPPIGTC